MRETSSTIAPGLAMAPPARPVPAPRGTTGVPVAWAMRITACTSATDAACTTASGGVALRHPERSSRVASRAAGSVVTDAPRASWRRARASVGIPPRSHRRVGERHVRFPLVDVGRPCEAGRMTPQSATLTRPARAAADPLADPVFAERYRAMQARDARFDGQFITGVHSTGIYCRPSCPAVAPKPSNVSFYLTAAAAHEAGLRACKRCLPDAVPGSPEWDLRDDLAARAMRLIADGVVEREGVPGLAARLGYTPRHLTRVLTAELGAGPLALSRAHRAQTARALLTSTTLPAADVAFASGFGSIRQFNDTIRAVYERSPLELRMAARLRERGVRAATGGRRRRAGRRPRRRARRAGCRAARGRRAPAAARSCAVRCRGRVRLARDPGARGGRAGRAPALRPHAPAARRAGPRAVRGRRRRPRAVDRRRGAPRDPRRPAAARRPGATPVRPRRRRRGDRHGPRRRPAARGIRRGRARHQGARMPRPPRTRLPGPRGPAGVGQGRTNGPRPARRRPRRARRPRRGVRRRPDAAVPHPGRDRRRG